MGTLVQVSPQQLAKRSKCVAAESAAGAIFHLEVHRTRMRLAQLASSAMAPAWDAAYATSSRASDSTSSIAAMQKATPMVRVVCPL